MIETREPNRTRARQDLAFSLAVAFVAILPRLFVAIAWSREPVWDGHYYHFGAERIAAGLGYSEDVFVDGHTAWKAWTHYPVGYSALLGAVYAAFGSKLLVAPIANAIIGTLAVVAVHRLALYYISRNRARIAAGLAALHPGLIVYSTVVMTEVLAGLLLVCAAWVAVAFRATWRGVLGAALLIGLATLVRPASLLVAPLIALTQPLSFYRALGLSAISSFLALVVVSPWTVRNCVRMDGCALVSTNGGWNLAIGALTETGRFRGLTAKDGCAVVSGQVEQDRCWARVGLETIIEDPVSWLALIPKKLSQTYDHESFAIEYLHEAAPEFWPPERRSAARGLLTFFHRLLLIAAALGVFADARRLRPVDHAQRSSPAYLLQAGGALFVLGFGVFAFASDAHPFYVLVVLTPLIALFKLPGHPRQGPVGRFVLGVLFMTSLTHAIFFGDDRYHLVLAPMLCMLAAAALRQPTRFHRSEGDGPADSGSANHDPSFPTDPDSETTVRAAAQDADSPGAPHQKPPVRTPREIPGGRRA